MSSIKGERIVQEVVGLCLLAITLFFLLSLVSYHPEDPCLNVFKKVHVEANQEISNYAGCLGAIVSDILIQSFGIISFFIPLMTLFIGLQIMCMRPLERKWTMLFGSICFLFATPSLIYLLFRNHQGLLTAHPVLISSGWIGKALAEDLFVPYLGDMGAYLLLITLWIASVMMVTHISLIGLLSAMGDCVHRGLNLFKCRDQRSVSVKERPSVSTKSAPVKKKQSGASVRVSHTVETEETHHDKNRHQLLPSYSILRKAEKSAQKKAEMEREIINNSRLLESKLMDFGVEGRVVQVHPGPVITRYEFEPAPGIKINRIANLSDDLALAMKALSVRIVAPVPGKSVVGLEIPNSKREIVVLRDVLTSKEFRNMNSKLALALGKDIAGKPYITDLAKMPHLLVAGATGSGKSVSVNSIICSILFNATADEVRFLMIDPKRLELGIYNDIPHLLVPVVMEPKHAANALRWATEEMDHRYHVLAEKGVRNIDQYNTLIENGSLTGEGEPIKKLPYIVIVIDEFADLMLMSGREVESLLTRLAQMARAVGLHLVIATQRPSVDIITGLIKANFPCRISFRVSSKTDSRTILDANGAEKLLGMGDMLFLPPGSSSLLRVHGSAVTEGEITSLVDFLKQQAVPDYDTSIIEDRGKEDEKADEDEEYDDLYDKAVELVVQTNKASISMVQRKLRIGYNRAARMIEIMERDGVVSKPDGSKPRQVLVRGEQEII